VVLTRRQIDDHLRRTAGPCIPGKQCQTDGIAEKSAPEAHVRRAMRWSIM